jgi:biopolymer transport protein ExbB/TolQ
MPLNLVIPILVSAAVVAVFVLLLRRIAALLAISRDAEVFRRRIVALGQELDRTLGTILPQVDALRRGTQEAATMAEALDAALAALVRLAEECRVLRWPAGTDAARIAFAAEIERADRGLQVIEHGTVILASGPEGPRLAEAHTSVKRGYLNVLHAQESLARQAVEIATAHTTVSGSIIR